MPSADQVKALIKSHAEGDDARFYMIAMQVAAQEARQGHSKAAGELRDTIDSAKQHLSQQGRKAQMVAVSKEMGEVLAITHPGLRLSHMVLEDTTRSQLERVLLENRQRARLQQFGLHPRRKLLLMGPPGSGKTMTAAVLAGELHLPLFTVRLEGLITKYLGETAAKLKLVFESMEKAPGVYFFDEFDSIGGQRAASNDVGEARRILSAFLQFLEQDSSPGLIVAATNHVSLLDNALFRRFDDLLEYNNPPPILRQELIQNRLVSFTTHQMNWEEINSASDGLSYAELAMACDDAAKDVVLFDRGSITTQDLIRSIQFRKSSQFRRPGG